MILTDAIRRLEAGRHLLGHEAALTAVDLDAVERLAAAQPHDPRAVLAAYAAAADRRVTETRDPKWPPDPVRPGIALLDQPGEPDWTLRGPPEEALTPPDDAAIWHRTCSGQTVLAVRPHDGGGWTLDMTRAATAPPVDPEDDTRVGLCALTGHLAGPDGGRPDPLQYDPRLALLRAGQREGLPDWASGLVRWSGWTPDYRAFEAAEGGWAGWPMTVHQVARHAGVTPGEVRRAARDRWHQGRHGWVPRELVYRVWGREPFDAVPLPHEASPDEHVTCQVTPA